MDRNNPITMDYPLSNKCPESLKQLLITVIFTFEFSK